MKKIYSIAAALLLAAATLTAVSCGKDSTDTGNDSNTVNTGNNNQNNSQSGLAGTVWKYNYSDLHKKNEGGGLKFLSQTQVTVIDWEYEHDTEYVEDVEESGTYEYTAPDGQLHLTSGDYRFFVDGSTLQLFNYDGYTQITMTRQ